MPLLRQWVELPELSAEEERELDARAMEILLLLPKDLRKCRYIHERVHETLDRWIVREREDARQQTAGGVVRRLKVVD